MKRGCSRSVRPAEDARTDPVKLIRRPFGMARAHLGAEPTDGG